MGFDGSGNFSRSHDFTDDRDAGINILASRMDEEFDNFATAMNVVFFRNGLVPLSGNLAMGGNSITGLAAGAVGTLSVRFSDDATSGIFLNGAGKPSIVAGGMTRLEANTSGVAVTGTLSVSGPATFTGAVSVEGNTTLGNASGDSVTFNASNISIPNGLAITGGDISAVNLTLTGNLTVQGTTNIGNSSGDAFNIYSSAVATPNGLTFSSGNLGVVTDSSANGLTLRGRSSDNVSDFSFKSNDGVTIYGQIQGRSTDFRFQAVGAVPYTLFVNGGERMRVTPSGVVLIGRTTETLGGGSGANLQIGSGSGNAGLTIHSGASSVGDMQFADGTSDPAAYAGMIRYNHSNNEMSFWANSAAVCTITPAGFSSLGVMNASGLITGSVGMNVPSNSAYRVNGRNVIAADAAAVMYLYSGGASGIVFRNGADTDVIGTISDTGVAAFNGTVSAEGIELGYRDAPQVAKNAAFSFALSDRGKHIYYTGAAAAATIPPNSTVAFPIGTVIVVVNDGSGTLTLTRGSGVVLLSNNVSVDKAVTVGNMATIIKVGTNRWFVS